VINKGNKYIVLSFDTESDIGSWTNNYTSIDIAMPEILKLLKKKSVKAVFFWEGKAALHNPEMVKKTFDGGFECGCHSYQHESVGKPSYFIPGDRAILDDEVFSRIKKNLEIVESITGERPTSFRAPRLWGDEIMIETLEKLGFIADSTYPITSAQDELFPYHPDASNIGEKGNLKLMEFPVMGLYKEIIKGISDDLLGFGLETTGADLNIGQWPILRLYGAEKFVELSKPFIEKQMALRQYSIISVYQHPWEFLPMQDILEGPEATCHLSRTLYENSGEFAFKALERMIDLYLEMGFKFVTLKELTEIIGG
jgi:peptidoglycan/xylan/chitin deacetylase (PgdA/CDA1 family)